MKIAHSSVLENPDAFDKLESEIGINLMLRHPNIVELVAFTNEGERFMIAFEFMDGGTLSSILGGRDKNKNEPPLSRAARYQIAIDVVIGLRYLHQKLLLHRDLKSENILFCSCPGRSVFPFVMKISDFGLSVVQRGDDLTSYLSVPFIDQVAGTLFYLAPELLAAEHDAVFPYTKATDVYSVALILWELMSYEMPFKRFEKRADEFRAHIKAGKREEVPDTPAILRDVVVRAWHQDPSKRPSVEEMKVLMEQGLAVELADKN